MTDSFNTLELIMFVRRLLVSAVLACLAACAAPTSTFVVDKNPNLKQRTSIGSVDALDYQLMPKRDSAAFSSTVSTQNANSTALCLQQHLSSEFKLPPEFVSHKVYTDNNHSVGLINPFTKVEGITMDVVNNGSNSEIKLYDNGNLLSRAWKQLPSKCGQGKTTTLAQESSSKAKPAAKAQSGVDFIAASKAETKPAVAVVANTPAVIKAAPVIKATPARSVKESIPATPLQAARVMPESKTTAFNASQNNAPKIVATAANEAAINTPLARISDTQANLNTSNFAARSDTVVANNNWEHGDLTQDDMNIIAPATAAVVTPAMAVAAQKMVSNNANNAKASSSRAVTTSKPSTSSKTVETSKAKATASKKQADSQEKASNSRSKTTAANQNNKQTAKDKTASNARNKADDNKTNSKNSRNKATEKAETNKNSRAKNSKADSADEKNSSKTKNNRNKTQNTDDNKTSKGKKTNERNVKADKPDNNSKTSNKKAAAKNTDSTKNNKKTTQERDNSSKAKASGNKSKATDKKAESAKKAPKKDKAK